MIEVSYVEDSPVEGECPPVLWFRGKPQDYLLFVNYIHILGRENDAVLYINENQQIKIKGNLTLIFKSTVNRKILLKREINNVLIELDKELWIPVIKQFLGISFSRCHQYIETDLYSGWIKREEFVEEGTIIISSD